MLITQKIIIDEIRRKQSSRQVSRYVHEEFWLSYLREALFASDAAIVRYASNTRFLYGIHGKKEAALTITG
jgi:hypothetical protein